MENRKLTIENPVLSSCYFPPIPWFAIAMQSGNILIDIHEHYIKQTWRNRCCIATANGLMNLVIPVEKYRNHTPMHEIRIDYSTNWQRVHEHAIRSAYGKSPFFEYYSDVILPMYEWQPEYLIEWNEASLNAIIETLSLPMVYENSSEYCEIPGDQSDWRHIIAPGKMDSPKLPAGKRYVQAFEERHGFQAGLSILDLLFCSGPESSQILKN